jgi:citrate synthase
MQMVIAGLAAYLGSDPAMIPTHSGKNIYHKNIRIVDQSIIRTLAALSVCIGLAACHKTGIPFTRADPNKGFLYNLLLMIGKVDKATGKPDPKHIFALQRTWALGAENGHTNSTAAILLSASTLSDPISCLICALSSGYGPLHFGAMEVSYKVMTAVGKPENVPTLIESVKRGEARLFGYGHRLYEVEDPRLRYSKQILKDIGADHPLINVAMEIDRIASSDEYFIKRNLHANADLYGVFIYIALYVKIKILLKRHLFESPRFTNQYLYREFEPSLVPVMMMATRSAGLMAHWKEAMC